MLSTSVGNRAHSLCCLTRYRPSDSGTLREPRCCWKGFRGVILHLFCWRCFTLYRKGRYYLEPLFPPEEGNSSVQLPGSTRWLQDCWREVALPPFLLLTLLIVRAHSKKRAIKKPAGLDPADEREMRMPTLKALTRLSTFLCSAVNILVGLACQKQIFLYSHRIFID